MAVHYGHSVVKPLRLSYPSVLSQGKLTPGMATFTPQF